MWSTSEAPAAQEHPFFQSVASVLVRLAVDFTATAIIMTRMAQARALRVILARTPAGPSLSKVRVDSDAAVKPHCQWTSSGQR